MHFLKILIISLFVGLVSCSSPAAKQKKIEKKQQKQQEKDSTALLYNPADGDQELDAFMQNLHRKLAFNGNVLIAKKGKIIYQNTFGWADYLHKDRLKITSKFALASVPKPLTALAVLKLVEEENLRVDQTVNDFFPDFPYPGGTVRLLLGHRSGVPNYIYCSEEAWKDRKKAMSNTDAMNLLIEHKPMRYG